jgi:hypothetical protein
VIDFKAHFNLKKWDAKVMFIEMKLSQPGSELEDV